MAVCEATFFVSSWEGQGRGRGRGRGRGQLLEDNIVLLSAEISLKCGVNFYGINYSAITLLPPSNFVAEIYNIVLPCSLCCMQILCFHF